MNGRIGQQLGNYRIVRLLGAGGFAEVYLGEHIHLKTKAAIKVQRTLLTDEDREQFRREAQTVANLDHPNIVRVLEFGVEGDTLFLVMSYASSGSLRQRHPNLWVSRLVCAIRTIPCSATPQGRSIRS